jgi:hypothetical protein
MVVNSCRYCPLQNGLFIFSVFFGKEKLHKKSRKFGFICFLLLKEALLKFNSHHVSNQIFQFYCINGCAGYQYHQQF